MVNQTLRFTIFTPTYNRQSTLHRVYDSLCQQTYRNFEWLIVDDGSTDDTRSLVEFWQLDSSFPIRYFYQENQGKHVAYNLAALQAQGELLVCLDSDDGCVPEALERFIHCWDSLSQAEKERYSGIDCHCVAQNGHKIGTDYPVISPANASDEQPSQGKLSHPNALVSNYSELRLNYRVAGEKWGFQRTAVMREFLFPELRELNMSHIPESIAWIPMTQKYPVLYVNEWLRTYYHDSGTEQLTKSNMMITNPIGVWLMNQVSLKWEMKYFTRSPVHFIKAAMNYSRSQWHIHRRYAHHPDFKRIQATELRSYRLPIVSLGNLLRFLCLPLAYLAYRRDLIRYGA